VSVEERNQRTVERIFDQLWNARDLSLADELMDEQMEDRGAITSEERGPAAAKDVVSRFRDGFPDLKLRLLDAVAEGEYVVVRWEGSGTHQGRFAVFEPTGRSVTITGIDIYRLIDGKVATHWGYPDEVGLAQQLMPAE
jgi:predicted ester cyclase